MNEPKRFKRLTTGLVVVDLQERLLPAIHEQQRVIDNCVCLIRGAGILGVFTTATEQYPKGLGRTVAAVTAALNGIQPVEKLEFSACGAPGLLDSLRGRSLTHVLLCGVEAHVCVTQTCLDLLDSGFHVYVVADAVSSRTPENYQIALRRMERSGAVLVSTEMVLFELLERAGTEEFKRILELVK